MSKFESSIKHIPYPQTAVYAMLSDLSNLEKVRDKLPEDKIKDLSFDRDSLSISAPMGSVAMKNRGEGRAQMHQVCHHKLSDCRQPVDTGGA